MNQKEIDRITEKAMKMLRGQTTRSSFWFDSSTEAAIRLAITEAEKAIFDNLKNLRESLSVDYQEFNQMMDIRDKQTRSKAFADAIKVVEEYHEKNCTNPHECCISHKGFKQALEKRRDGE